MQVYRQGLSRILQLFSSLSPFYSELVIVILSHVFLPHQPALCSRHPPPQIITMSAPLSQPNGYTLNTPRLIIRTAQSHDVGPLHAYLTTPANYGTVADLTIESLRERIDKWAASTAAGKSAFMILVLRDHGKPRNAGDEVIGFGGFNSLPRTKMLNPEARSADEVPEAEKVLLGDLGVSLTPRCRRKVNAYFRT